ncbi:MAG: ferredoxin [Candidatus Omnitrophica bacterium]|nr:ferredoxin [Candidatus Omnitrophota bacterium]MCF7894065.1 ferredoxin [Candidatus Omnitrophota bacterium]
MKIIIDENACIGCGLCINLCPEIFVLQDNNIAKVKSKEPCDKNLHKIASQCPVNAILIKD